MDQLKAYLRPFIRPVQRRFRQGIRSVRRNLLFTWRHLPWVSSSENVPLRYFEDPESWAIAEGGIYRKLFDPETVKRQPPFTTEPIVHWKIRREYSRTLPPIYFLEIPEGRVWVHHNAARHTDSIAVISAQNSLIGGISYEFSRARHLGEHVIFSQFHLAKPLVLTGKSLLLANIKGEQFYHWMLELLPKLSHFDPGKWNTFDHIIVNDFSAAFMQESFALLGIDSDKVVSLQDSPHIKAEHLSVPSPSGLSGNPPKWAVEWLRKTFLPKIKLPSSSTPKIYISRAASFVRKVLNETEIYPFLENEGFEILQLENMSLHDQIAAFATAESVISPHGAGLSHLVFAPSGCTVLEFFDPLYVNACFFALANSCKHLYTYCMGQGNAPKEGVDLEINISDITLNTTSLEAAYRKKQHNSIQEYKNAF